MMRYQTFFLAWLLFSVVHSNAMEQKPELNTDNSVSLIYYPYSKQHVGTSAVEVEGTAWWLNTPAPWDNTQFGRLIDKSTKAGKPFFRFVFKADADQIDTIKRVINQKVEDSQYASCSRAALHPLSEAHVCSVPLPFNATPLLSAAYLITGKSLGLNNVQKIEYYGNPSMTKSVITMISGAAFEGVATGLMVSLPSYAIWLAWQIAQTQENNL